MKTYYKSVIFTISLIFALSVSISAAPGDLDPTFGNGGIVITRGSSFSNLDVALGMAIQADGKIIVVGDGIFTGPTYDFAVVRYNPDGSLDSSFGGSGIVITPIGNSHDTATSVAIQADGKIVVAGSMCHGVGNCSGAGSIAVVRYNPNGSLDTSFNSTGKVITSVNHSSSATSLAIQTDGRIVVTGITLDGITPDGSTNNIAIVRYNSDGSLDTTFNGSGIITAPNGNNSSYSPSLVIQADGKLVVQGSSYNGSGFDLTVFRYGTDGLLDTSFNGTGKVNSPGVGAAGLAIQPDGKIVVVGNSYDTSVGSRFAAVRYNTDGSLDTSFGGSGKIIIPIGFHAASVAIQANGKIVAAGNGANDTVSGFAVVRLNPNGSLDNSFSGVGKVITPFCCQTYAIATAIQADGKIVVAGGTDDILYDFYDFVVVRYQGGGATPTPTDCSNSIDCNEFFVRQHYLDFLNREPDNGGLAYWTNEISQCGNDAACIHRRRIGVSAAFFIEQEFQETGYFVYRFYKASFGRQPNYAEFTSDRSRLIDGTNLEASRQTFADEWVQRPAFVAAYPTTMSNIEFVNKLFDSAGLTSARYDALRQQEIFALNAGRSRALVLRDVIEIPVFKNIPDPNDPRYNELKQVSQYNPAFVLMQYFGYLRRDVDQGGYDFWLDVVNNREINNYRGMVCAFVTSTEYQLRFGSTVTRSNADCSQ